MKLKKDVTIPLIIALITIALFIHAASTLTSVWVFVPAVIAAYVIYLNTFYRNTPKPDKILPIYLLALAIQFIHFTEEYLTDFIIEIPKLFGQNPYPEDYWVAFNMIAYSVFIMGGIALFKQMKEFMIIPLFFILAGVILNSIAHIGLSIYVGGYFPGLYTALIYAVIGPVLIKRVVDETKIIDEI